MLENVALETAKKAFQQIQKIDEKIITLDLSKEEKEKIQRFEEFYPQLNDFLNNSKQKNSTKIIKLANILKSNIL